MLQIQIAFVTTCVQSTAAFLGSIKVRLFPELFIQFVLAVIKDECVDWRVTHSVAAFWCRHLSRFDQEQGAPSTFQLLIGPMSCTARERIRQRGSISLFFLSRLLFRLGIMQRVIYINTCAFCARKFECHLEACSAPEGARRSVARASALWRRMCAPAIQRSTDTSLKGSFAHNGGA